MLTQKFKKLPLAARTEYFVFSEDFATFQHGLFN